LSKTTVNATYCIIRALNFDQEDGLLEAWLSSQFWSEEHTSSCWSDLTTTSVNSISVECNILDVKADTSHVFISQNTFFGSPLEGCLTRVLDFSHELALLSHIN
jgi:hypothetical protein